MGGLEYMIAQVGLPVSLVIFFVWQGHKREIARCREATAREGLLVQRIERLEQYNESTLSGLVQKTTSALTENTNALQKNSEVLEDSLEVMREIKEIIGDGKSA